MIQIGVSVDARAVKEAKASIDAMNGALRDTEGREKLLGDDKYLSGVAGLIRGVTDDINRMHRISAENSRSGGILKKEQFAEVEKINRRLLETFGAYVGKISLARSELKKLIQEKQALANKENETGRLDPAERLRMEALEKRIAASRRMVDRHTDRAEEMRTRLNVANENVQGADMRGGGGGGGMLGGLGSMRMMLGAAAMAWITSKAIGFVKEGMASDEAISDREINPYARGAKYIDYRRGSYGYDLATHVGINDQINKVGGYGGAELSHLAETTKAFSRGQGTDVNATSAYMGSLGAITGMGSAGLRDSMEKLRGAFLQGGVGGRSEEFMQRNLQLLEKVAHGRGGAISEGQSAYLTALQAAMWSGDSPVGKGQSGMSMIDSIDSLVRGGGGSAGEQMFMWQAMGGDGTQTAEGLWDFKKRLAEGASQRNVDSFYQQARKTYGTDSEGNLSVYGKLSLLQMLKGMAPDQIDEIVRLGDAGVLASPEQGAAAGSVEGDAGRLMANRRGKVLGNKTALEAEQARTSAIGVDTKTDFRGLGTKILNVFSDHHAPDTPGFNTPVPKDTSAPGGNQTKAAAEDIGGAVRDAMRESADENRRTPQPVIIMNGPSSPTGAQGTSH